MWRQAFARDAAFGVDDQALPLTRGRGRIGADHIHLIENGIGLHKDLLLSAVTGGGHLIDDYIGPQPSQLSTPSWGNQMS
ncbi:hypothetical protein [Halomonas sp. ISL-56]|uniref:hypothetical protein n=1 Tax=Halomonas sp. ISL-56 TaxID=2819149 RepID=UPI002035544E|nr:hypothetical protein [Halomonas sp. ISL-56]